MTIDSVTSQRKKTKLGLCKVKLSTQTCTVSTVEVVMSKLKKAIFELLKGILIFGLLHFTVICYIMCTCIVKWNAFSPRLGFLLPSFYLCIHALITLHDVEVTERRLLRSFELVRPRMQCLCENYVPMSANVNFWAWAIIQFVSVSVMTDNSQRGACDDWVMQADVSTTVD